MKKNTYMYRQGYRYYVYIGPGNISYFFTLNDAAEYAEETGGKIGEVE